MTTGLAAYTASSYGSRPGAGHGVPPCTCSTANDPGSPHPSSSQKNSSPSAGSARPVSYARSAAQSSSATYGSGSPPDDGRGTPSGSTGSPPSRATGGAPLHRPHARTSCTAGRSSAANAAPRSAPSTSYARVAA
ncbi:MAG TPA: hypothetical protein VF519_11735 [Mycobacteriales bacterium]